MIALEAVKNFVIRFQVKELTNLGGNGRLTVLGKSGGRHHDLEVTPSSLGWVNNQEAQFAIGPIEFAQMVRTLESEIAVASPVTLPKFMPEMSTQITKITIDLPEGAFSSLRQSKAEFAAELRLAAAVKWYEMGKFSQEKAAELAGLSRAEFISALERFRVSPFQVEPRELAHELGSP